MLILMMMIAADRKHQNQQASSSLSSASRSTAASGAPTINSLGQQEQLQQSAITVREKNQKSSTTLQHLKPESSNSSNETVIARVPSPKSDSNTDLEAPLQVDLADSLDISDTTTARRHVCSSSTRADGDCDHQYGGRLQQQQPEGRQQSRLKSFLLFTAHLNPFHHHHQQQQQQSNSRANSTSADQNKSKGSVECWPTTAAQANQTCSSETPANSTAANEKQISSLLSFAKRYFLANSAGSAQISSKGTGKHSANIDLLRIDQDETNSCASSVPLKSKSAPVTPIKWRPLDADQQAGLNPGRIIGQCNGILGSNSSNLVEDPCSVAKCDSTLSHKYEVSSASGLSPLPMKTTDSKRPSVRFVETLGSSDEDSCKINKRVNQYTDCAVQTSFSTEKQDLSLPAEVDLVAKLFEKRPNQANEPGESPMDSKKFREYGFNLIEYISNYLDTIDKRRVTPLNIEPGYLKSLIQANAPEQGESFATIMNDFENHIMCGITHWQHPHFHAYFPAGNAYPSILADMLGDALGCVGFSWAASPAYTELEIIMLDWMGKMIGLPDEFLCLSGGRTGASNNCSTTSSSGEQSRGGGVIQGSASECVLVNLLAARHWAIEKLRKKYPATDDGLLLTKLIGYCSKEAHSCVEKAAMVGFIRMRTLETDERHSLRGETLLRAIEQDEANGLEPFLVCATLGTTSCVSFDNLEELGKVCKDRDIWLHVDAAYAGSALICPEFKYLMRGIEMASSFNMNPNKWMLINFDCSLMWVKDRFKLTRAFVVDPLYLQHSFSDQAIDYRHWGIPLSRRFRALKLWFVIRNYGVEGLRSYIRNHVRLAKLFESYIRQDSRFSITNEVVLGLVCFRLVGSNALNQRFLSMINASGKLHMVPASLNGRYVIRFCVCDQYAKDADIEYAYHCISTLASELFDSIRAGKERIRAISQQNTIDVSSISLHTQQSASADRLNTCQQQQQLDDQKQPVAGDAPAIEGRSHAVSPRQAARQSMLRRNSRHESAPSESIDLMRLQPESCLTTTPVVSNDSSRTMNNLSPLPKSPLVKQASVQPSGTDLSGDEDLEQEICLESMGGLDEIGYDDYDYDYDGDDLNDLMGTDSDETMRESRTRSSEIHSNAFAGSTHLDLSDSRSPVARYARSSRNASTAGEHPDEASDELFNLVERRNRMSLRYKREFFVRVVSDPRVYRASISGDINAHASCSSLGGISQQPQQQQQQPKRQPQLEQRQADEKAPKVSHGTEKDEGANS